LTTLGFTAIVKNEAGVIERALDSVRSLCDYVLISDTGSEDGTPEVIRAWLQRNGVAGDVMERPWVDFSYNRNEAIEALRGVSHVDYVLTIDADEYLVFDPGFDPEVFKASLTSADAWRVVSRVDSYKFNRLQLFSNRLPFRFVQKMHEYVQTPEGTRIATATGFFNQYTYDGARMRNPTKYLDDALVMEAEFAAGGYDDPVRRPRGVYYLAQCYRDAKYLEKARDLYLERTTMGGSRDEIAWSYYNAALLMKRLDQPDEQIIATHLKAYEAGPNRAEPLCLAAQLANLNHWHQQAYMFSKIAADLREPDVMLLDSAVYEWRALDELQVAAIGTGRFGEAVEIAERLLSEAKFPESERQRIEQNAAYALAQYELAPVIGPDAASGLAN